LIARKSDAAQIRDALEGLKNSDWLGDARRWWPSFLFRFDDIQNAISILTCGHLRCRNKRGTAVETAATSIIAGTEARWKDHVRLYFRPRTPTQHHIEGIRPKGQLGSLEAHMPVPVFFLLDSAEVLTRETTMFSDGSLAAKHPNFVAGDFVAFARIPFAKVYHDSPLSDDEKANIMYHRHAEVVVPEELSLDGVLKYIWVRSEAERETLLNVLPADISKKYEPIIYASRANLFFRKWTFLERASLTQDLVDLAFNLSSIAPGPFHARLVIGYQANGMTLELKWDETDFFANRPFKIQIPQLKGTQTEYTATFYLDETIAFKGRYRPANVLV